MGTSLAEMKVYISVDIEGVAGITHWDEAEKGHADWAEFREIMTREAIAAIDGARAAGATEIWVKDAHDSGRNLITTLLPADVTLIREWSGHPYSMIQELDESFAALVMIGHHASVGSEGNSLAHTLNTRTHMITLNGKPVSEFRLCALAAASLGVPTVFVSGDKALMEEIKETNSHIGRLAVKEGRGQSTISMTPRGRAKCHPGRGRKIPARKVEGLPVAGSGKIYPGSDLCEPGIGLRKEFLSGLQISRQPHQPR